MKCIALDSGKTPICRKEACTYTFNLAAVQISLNGAELRQTADLHKVRFSGGEQNMTDFCHFQQKGKVNISFWHKKNRYKANDTRRDG